MMASCDKPIVWSKYKLKAINKNVEEEWIKDEISVRAQGGGGGVRGGGIWGHIWIDEPSGRLHNWNLTSKDVRFWRLIIDVLSYLFVVTSDKTVCLQTRRIYDLVAVIYRQLIISGLILRAPMVTRVDILFFY